ncbi:PH domain-containing protein [Amycolatopsis sp.]|uniref:PH domain-containing protein n=1 Tax=Amycolatopsis sp. TaxID=37632 RepID=UPI002DFF08ED|nr:PH domain-containing protein [Amycolatopsis sp.]
MTTLPDVVAEETGTGEGWRRLSPRMLVVHPLNELLRAAPALLAVLVVGATSGRGPWWSVAGAGALVLMGILRWFTTTYRVTPRQVQVRKGLVRRRVLTVPTDRVRTVDVDAQALHRILGLAKVSIGTGRSDKSDEGIKLDALSKGAAERLRGELLHRRPVAVQAGENTEGNVPAPDPEVVLASLQPGWIKYGPFTLSGFVTVGIVAAFVFRLISESNVDPDRFGPFRVVFHHLSSVSIARAISEAIVTLVVVVVVASTVGYVLAFWNYRLTRHSGGTLHVSRGAISTRSTTIEERRLRGVEISEPLLLRAVKGARILAITTGLRVGRGAERGGTLLLPPAPRDEAERVARDVLTDPAAVSAGLVSHGPRARRRRYNRALGMCAILVGILFVLWATDVAGLDLALASLVLLPIGALLAADRYRSLGHAVSESPSGATLVGRHGSLVRRRVMLSRDGIIGWNVHQSFFQRRSGLATLIATTAAGHQHYEIVDVELAEALRVADQALPGLVTPFLVHPNV